MALCPAYMLMGLPAETPDFVHPMLVSPQVSPLCFCPLLSSPGSQVLAGLKLTLLQNQQEKKAVVFNNKRSEGCLLMIYNNAWGRH